MPNRLVLYIALFLTSFSCFSQNLVKGTFLEKSTKIGQPIEYALSFYHPKEMELFFPDSSFSYAPFDYIDKEYFPTKTIDSISLDSVVYTLRTFELKTSLSLSLPVFIIDLGDTVQQFSTSDKIIIKQYLKEVPDSLIFMSDVGYKPVSQKFNYPYYLTFALVLILMLGLFYFLLGKAVLRNYRLYVMYKNHRQFLTTFDKLLREMARSPNLLSMEKVVGEWKNYLTKLEQKPINTYTTTEIISLFNREELKENLQNVDRSIYSGSISGKPMEALEVLRKFSNKRYNKRRKELRNAR